MPIPDRRTSGKEGNFILILVNCTLNPKERRNSPIESPHT